MMYQNPNVYLSIRLDLTARGTVGHRQRVILDHAIQQNNQNDDSMGNPSGRANESTGTTTVTVHQRQAEFSCICIC